MDALDRAILVALREDARLPVAELARRVGTSRATAHDRLKRLQDRGVILGATIRLDPAALGHPLRGFLMVGWRAEHQDQRAVARSIATIPGVERVHIITGPHDFLVEVMAPDMDAVGRIIIERIRSIPGVGATETLLSFWSFDGPGVVEPVYAVDG